MSVEATKTTAPRTVDARKRWLVEEGDKLGKLARDNREWKHQVRTIWEAARAETEPLVLLNLLRYQAARNAKTWREPEDAFEALQEGIEECRKWAGDDVELAMDLIRHLLAYTYRAYTFHAG